MQAQMNLSFELYLNTHQRTLLSRPILKFAWGEFFRRWRIFQRIYTDLVTVALPFTISTLFYHFIQIDISLIASLGLQLIFFCGKPHDHLLIAVRPAAISSTLYCKSEIFPCAECDQTFFVLLYFKNKINIFLKMSLFPLG